MIYYITHPNVEIEPHVPVPQWRLSVEGQRRTKVMLDQPWIADITRIISSDERKAVQTAESLGEYLRLDLEVRPSTGENDRSSTGFVPPDDFELLANAFFESPEASTQGWERAIDAQHRIVESLADLVHEQLQATPAPTVAVVGHGGVGTLWYCHLAGLPIDRSHDQPGQGHYFAVGVEAGQARPIHGWLPIDGTPLPSE